MVEFVGIVGYNSRLVGFTHAVVERVVYNAGLIMILMW